MVLSSERTCWVGNVDPSPDDRAAIESVDRRAIIRQIVHRSITSPFPHLAALHVGYLLSLGLMVRSALRRVSNHVASSFEMRASPVSQDEGGATDVLLFLLGQLLLRALLDRRRRGRRGG